MTPKIDYPGVFAALPSPCLVLGTDLVIADANPAFCAVTGRTRGELVGQYLFDTFPNNPADPEADGVATLKDSLHRVLSSRQTDHMALQKYDIPISGNPDAFKERWWTAINVPVLGPDGEVAWICAAGPSGRRAARRNRPERSPRRRSSPGPHRAGGAGR
ncbi:PAS domain-containing protein [Streptomyces sp. SAS_269]|uniref:PAS domain-containing protein n=1 Tax=Streptomyces sp. SAS_269 TaxID=3412749 RepID=UPI00403CF959